MIDSDDRQRFERIFRMNVERRSRTAKGKDEGSKTSSDKLPLLLQGEALKAKVAENVEVLVADVFADATEARLRTPEIRASDLRARCERWFDIACDGLIDHAAYGPKFAEIEAKAAKLGKKLALNRRYRVWTPKYLVLQTPPAMIDDALSELYVWLALNLTIISPPGPGADAGVLAGLQAQVDVMMDGEIHPWIDGCSRVATALVMWLAAYYETTAPLFAPTKEEHYRTIQDIEAHAAYYLECFRRAGAEVP